MTKPLSLTDFYANVLTAAFASPVTPWPAGPTGGCGRAYVCLTGLDLKKKRALAAASKRLGLLYLTKAYGTGGNALYIGYDNATGVALAKAEAVAASLNASGVACYTDAVGD
jgi:hypothetical protein